MEESDIRSPLYYVIGRDISKEDLEAAQWVFTITPCATGVVSRPGDKKLIEPVVFQVFKADDEAACKELAAHLARSTRSPTITVGEGTQMTAVYHDGVIETICLPSLSKS